MLSRLSFLLWALSLVSQSFAADTLLFAVDIIRHGDRTALIELPAANYHEPLGLGQLTATGMQQEYQLGHTLRDEYIQKDLLPTQYQTISPHLLTLLSFQKAIMTSSR